MIKENLRSSAAPKALAAGARAPALTLDGLPVGRRARQRARSRGIPYVTLPHVDRPTYARPKRGESIRAFVDRTGWEKRGLAMIAVEVDRDGKASPILRRDWTRKIKSTDQICFVARPAGGGGASRQIGAIVALIALMVISTVVAGPGGLIASTGFGAAIGSAGLAVISSVIVAGGSLLISAFLAPKSGAKSDDDTSFSSSLSGNRARPQQPIPVQYGRLKFTPDFAAQPWADFVGEDQVFYGLYTLGMGEFDVEEIGVADTPIWTAADGVADGFENFEYEIVEADEDVTLFPVNVVSATEVTGIELPDPDPGTEWVGPFVLNPAGTSGTQVAMDVVFPGGCYRSDGEGKIVNASQRVLFEYRYVDSSGVPIGGTGASYTTLFDQTFTFRSVKPVRRTLTATLPSAGRIQVRAGIPTAARRQNGSTVVYWQGARMFLGGSQSRPKVTQLAVKILADQQFSGYARQQLYVIATRKLPVWNGSAWVTQATQNPLWAYTDFWTNADYGCGRPLAKADLATIYAEATEATSRGDTFNHRFTEIMSCMEALETILRPIIARPLFIGGMLSLVRDKARTIPNLMLTDFSIIRGSVSVDYPLQTEDESDGTILEYLEEQIWQPAEVSSSGSVATLLKPARVQIRGVTNRPQATRLTRYLALTNSKRRKTVTVDVEAEGRLVKLGDLVCLSSDIMALGGQTMRVASYTIPGVGGPKINTDAEMPAPAWAASGDHYVRVRRRNGRPFGPVKVSQGANAREIVVDPTDLALVEAAQGVTFSSSMLREATDEPVELSFSPGSPREFLGLVTTLRVIDGERFRLSLVQYDADVYDVSGAIPALPDAPALITPPTPSAPTSVVATMQQIGVVMTLSASWKPDIGSTRYLAQISQDDGDTWQDAFNGPSPGFNLQGVPAVDTLVRIRGERITENGVISGPWSTPVEAVAPRLNLEPSNVGYTINSADIGAPLFDRIWQGQAEVDGNAAAEAFAAEMLRHEEVRLANARVTQETILRETENSALAAQITTVEAKSDAGTATGRVRFLASSSLGSGVAAAFDVEVKSEVDGGTFSAAGLRLEVMDDDSSRIVLTADRFYVRDGSDDVIPFAIIDGDLYAANTRFLDFVRSDDVDANGDPLWRIGPDGTAEFRSAFISGTLGAAEVGVGEEFRLARGAKILNGQWPPWPLSLTGFGSISGTSFSIREDYLSIGGGGLGNYYFTGERTLAEPWPYSGGSGTTSWLMPDGVVRTTANIDTDPSGSSTPIGFFHPLDWNPGFFNIAYPYKMICPALGGDRDFVVPAGCTAIAFKLWGGGGGLGSALSTSLFGGAGGYVAGTIPVEPGWKIRVQVGGGGSAASAFSVPSAGSYSFPNRGYAGAGVGRFGRTQRASGGGRTAIFRVLEDGSLVPLAIAAGGGSAHISTSGTPGAPDGTYGSYNSTWAGGEGVGAPAANDNDGAGGGGWKGGTLGNGGANYIDSSATGTTNSAGSSATPPNTSDADYVEFTTRTNANFAPGRGFGLNNRAAIVHTVTSVQNGRFGNGGLAVLDLLNT